MTKPVKLSILGAVAALLPFVIFVGATSYQATNGKLTSYSYLNIAAIVGGVAAIFLAVALVRGGPSVMSEYRRPGWAIPVCVALVLVGALQVVRGVGVFPEVTGCVTESGSAGFCAELPESDPLLP